MSETELWREIKRLQLQVERLQTREKSLASDFYGGLDLTPAAQTFVIANNATVAPFVSGDNFSGLIIINDLVTGSTGLIVAGGAATQVVADTLGSTFSATAGAASRISVYYTAFPNYVLTIENKIGSSRTLIIAPIRTRTSA